MSVKNCIDNISGISADVTFRDLRVHYRTGRAVRLSGTGRDKEYTYRVGVQTDLGDIELSVWQEAMQRLIHASSEDELQQALRAYVKDNICWWHTQAERLQESLELHACRTFEDPRWTDYDLFYQGYFQKVKSNEGGSELE